MPTATNVTPTQRAPELLGQTGVVIGGSAGIGLETARRVRSEYSAVDTAGQARNTVAFRYRRTAIGSAAQV